MLKKDSLHRGAHAIHVSDHYKLGGKHRTIASFAVLAINMVLACHKVKQVRLGQLAPISGTAHSKNPGFQIVRDNNYFRFSIWNHHVFQTFRVYPKPGMEEFVEDLLKRISEVSIGS